MATGAPISPGAITPRDQLDRLLALVRRAMRRWWIAAIVGVVGTALTIVLALLRSNSYESASVIMYQEVISSRLLLGSGAAGERSRGMALRFREMTMARPLLEKVIVENGLHPKLIEAEGMGAAIEEVRKQVGFRSGGGGTFTVSYKASTREEAQAVTASIATNLIEWEKELQLKSTSTTKEFLERQRSMVETTLKEREHDLAAFLRAHPEFAVETATQNSAGAGVRAAAQSTRRPSSSDPKLRALERQRDRIEARLEALRAPDSAPRQPSNREPTAEERAAENALRVAQRDLDTAKRNLENKRARFTDQHPDVVIAKTNLRAAEQRVSAAESELATARRGGAEVPAPSEDRPADIARLTAELADVTDKITSYRRSMKKDKPQDSETDEGVDQIVLLEAEHQRLRREVNELRERYQAVEAKAFTAEMAAASEAASQGSQLAIIEPAYRPSRPVGASRSKLVLAGMVVFTGIGMMIAFGLALIDDRIVSKYDIERLDLVPVLAVVPMRATSRKRVPNKQRRELTDA